MNLKQVILVQNVSGQFDTYSHDGLEITLNSGTPFYLPCTCCDDVVPGSIRLHPTKGYFFVSSDLSSLEMLENGLEGFIEV